ncbi:hypothetical protein ABEG18_15575 [Alsobacter sp. KACC 23698]|uniref:Cellulose-binding protein n=1 Tax=Alsobacter sp. KACC 23698 TaxID=3149229 RepID=A0AAU7JA40_9HYPH
MKGRSGEVMRLRPIGGSSQPAKPDPKSETDEEAVPPAARETPPWSGTLGLAFRAGERMRAESARLKELELRTRDLHRAFMQERHSAMARLHEIRARAEAADMRVSAAEKEVEQVGASVVDATARLAATEERVRDARERIRDAEHWLRRIHNAIEATPFTGPSSAPFSEPDDDVTGAPEAPKASSARAALSA